MLAGYAVAVGEPGIPLNWDGSLTGTHAGGEWPGVCANQDYAQSPILISEESLVATVAGGYQLRGNGFGWIRDPILYCSQRGFCKM